MTGYTHTHSHTLTHTHTLKNSHTHSNSHTHTLTLNKKHADVPFFPPDPLRKPIGGWRAGRAFVTEQTAVLLGELVTQLIKVQFWALKSSLELGVGGEGGGGLMHGKDRKSGSWRI